MGKFDISRARHPTRSKVSITLPNEMLGVIDWLAVKHNTPRSVIITLLLNESDWDLVVERYLAGRKKVLL